MPEIQKVTFTKGAGNLLAQALSMPDWSGNRGEKYHAGQLIAEQLDFVMEAPASEDRRNPTAAEDAAFTAWAAEEVTIEWTQRQRDVVNVCLDKVYNRLPCGRHLNRLIQALGLQPD